MGTKCGKGNAAEPWTDAGVEEKTQGRVKKSFKGQGGRKGM